MQPGSEWKRGRPGNNSEKYSNFFGNDGKGLVLDFAVISYDYAPVQGLINIDNKKIGRTCNYAEPAFFVDILCVSWSRNYR